MIMKKQITVFLLVSIITAALTACADDNVSEPFSEQNSMTGDTASNAEMEVCIYGQAEIPDIPCEDKDSEGKARLGPDSVDSVKLQGCLDRMVFEIHTFGDYTVKLVGDSVRTDEVDFPGSIYTQKLRVEVEKDGVQLKGDGSYNDTVIYVSQFAKEYRLFADKIGSYLDVYDLDYPVIAMRYYFDNGSERTVIQTAEFATIQDNELYSGFGGIFEEGVGVMLNPDKDVAELGTMLITNGAESKTCRVGTFSSEEFTVEDKKTLADLAAGVKYTFHFCDPPQFELYTAERIH